MPKALKYFGVPSKQKSSRLSERLDGGNDSSWHTGSHSEAFVSMAHVRQVHANTDEPDGGAERLKLAMNRALSELSVAVKQLVSQSTNESDSESTKGGSHQDEAPAHRLHHAPNYARSSAHAWDTTEYAVSAASSAVHVSRVRDRPRNAGPQDVRPARYSSMPQQHAAPSTASSRVSHYSSSEGTASPDILSPWKARQIAKR